MESSENDRLDRPNVQSIYESSYSEQKRHKSRRNARKRRTLTSLNDPYDIFKNPQELNDNSKLPTSQPRSGTTTINITTSQGKKPSYRLSTFFTTSWILSIYLLVIICQHQQHQQFGCLAFNVDTQYAIVHSGPKGSYFGYSVAQHKDRGVNWLLVGAPKTQTDQPGTSQSGAVYRCTPNNAKACQQIPFDPTGASVITLRGEQVKTDDKSHQWFGASLQSATDNGSIVACAPKYVYFSTNLKRRDPVGTCWVSRGSFNGFLEYSPCRLNGECHRPTCLILPSLPKSLN